mmetsp:Transcript_1347/g.5102  ORF Transcript_1347/g.5102 Transcript_1347/m.5102 type:complete len:239 (-) Transcript_1347:691-1407(-)
MCEISHFFALCPSRVSLSSIPILRYPRILRGSQRRRRHVHPPLPEILEHADKLRRDVDVPQRQERPGPVPRGALLHPPRDDERATRRSHRLERRAHLPVAAVVLRVQQPHGGVVPQDEGGAGHERRLLAVQRRARQPQPSSMGGCLGLINKRAGIVVVVARPLPANKLRDAPPHLRRAQRPLVRVRHRELVHRDGARRAHRQRAAQHRTVAVVQRVERSGEDDTAVRLGRDADGGADA